MLLLRFWTDTSLDDKISDEERSELAQWDFPVTDKYSRLLTDMRQSTPFPLSIDQAVERVRSSQSESEGFAWIGEI